MRVIAGSGEYILRYGRNAGLNLPIENIQFFIRVQYCWVAPIIWPCRASISLLKLRGSYGKTGADPKRIYSAIVMVL